MKNIYPDYSALLSQNKPTLYNTYNMVVTVKQSIPINALDFFLRERDALNTQFGVQLKFPKGREFMYGNSQTMLMIGLQSKINQMLPQVRRILEEAHEQYLSFKERRAARKANEKFFTKAPEANVKKVKVPKKKQNPFAALEGLFEQEQVLNDKERKSPEEKAILDGKAPKPMETAKTTMNFVAAAAKPKLEELTEVFTLVENPKVKLILKNHVQAPINGAQKTISWADMADSLSDDEDDEGDEGGDDTWDNIDWVAM